MSATFAGRFETWAGIKPAPTTCAFFAEGCSSRYMDADGADFPTKYRQFPQCNGHWLVQQQSSRFFVPQNDVLLHWSGNRELEGFLAQSTFALPTALSLLSKNDEITTTSV